MTSDDFFAELHKLNRSKKIVFNAELIMCRLLLEIHRAGIDIGEVHNEELNSMPIDVAALYYRSCVDKDRAYAPAIMLKREVEDDSTIYSRDKRYASIGINTFIIDFVKRYDDVFLETIILAHEFGHHITETKGLTDRQKVNEANTLFTKNKSLTRKQTNVLIKDETLAWNEGIRQLELLDCKWVHLAYFCKDNALTTVRRAIRTLNKQNGLLSRLIKTSK